MKRLRDARNETVVEMLAAIQAHGLAYRQFETLEEEDAWAATVGSLFDLFLEIADEGRGLTRAERDEIRAVGTARTEQGIDVGSIKSSIRTAVRVARKRIIKEYAPTSDEDHIELDRVIELLEAFGNGLEDLMEEGVRGSQPLRPSSSHQDLTACLQDVIDRRLGNVEDLNRRVEELACHGSSSGIQYALFLLGDPEVAERAASALSDAYVAHSRPTNRRSPHSAVLVRDKGGRDWTKTVQTVRAVANDTGATVVACDPCPRIDRLYDSYVLARPVIPYLGMLASQGEVVAAKDLAIAMIVAALPRDVRQVLRRRCFSGLRSCDEDEARRLRDYLAVNVRLGFSVVALQRHTRRNKKTLYEWRARFSDLTGYTFTEPSDRAMLTLAHYADLFEPRLAPA